MDKKKLYNDIAKIRKQLFSLTIFVGFLVVVIATLLGRGFDPYQIFVNAVVAIILFGILGFAWGKIYENIVEKALVDSYREEAKKELDQMRTDAEEKVEMSLAATELEPGMKVIDTVYSNEGALLVREGTVLTNQLISTILDNDIAEVKVEAQRQFNQEE